jgi:hypothetical protein
MPFGNLNVDTVTTSTAGGILGAGNASIMKNRIINGAMVISQRNGTSSVTAVNGAYSLDRYQSVSSQSSKFSIQQNAGSVTPPAGFTNYLGATSLSAYSVTSTDNFLFQQLVEGYNTADLGWGTANAKTVTLSFWVRSSLTGTFGGALLNNASDRSYVFSYTISAANTWEQKTVTIAGDTSGSWDTTNNVGIRLAFSLGAGTSVSGTAGSWASNGNVSVTGATSVVGTNGATFYITGVQLEVGSSATGFEYVNYQTSLANCQRYYSKSAQTGTAPADGNTYNTDCVYQMNVTNSTSTLVTSFFSFPQNMRSAPTITFYRSSLSATAGKWGYYTGSWQNASATTTACLTDKGMTVEMGGTYTANNAYTIAGGWSASAEL